MQLKQIETEWDHNRDNKAQARSQSWTLFVNRDKKKGNRGQTSRNNTNCYVAYFKVTAAT